MWQVLALYSLPILLMIVSIPGLIWGIYDNKRREREEQEEEEAAASEEAQ